MMNNKSLRSREFYVYGVPAMIIDIAIHIVVFEFILGVFKFFDPADVVLLRPRTIYFLVVGYIVAIMMFPPRFYDRGVITRQIVFRAFAQTFIALSVFALSVFILFGSFAGKFFLQEGIAATVLISAFHLLFRSAINYARKKGRNREHVVIVGSNENAKLLENTLRGDKSFDDYQIDAVFDGNDIDEVCAYLSENNIHTVYCSLNPAKREQDVNRVIRTCENLFIEFFYVPNMDGYLKRSMTFSNLGKVTLVSLRDEPLDYPLNAAVKRVADIVFSGLFLLTLYPFIWLVVAIGIKISSPGPVLFRQKRTGYKGRSFTMLKFRSMKVNADADRVQATEDDPRKTKFGDFLRRTSIDELPQFINVFRGDMSMIGPRPHMELHTEMYKKLIDEYLVRHMVRPGLTGWAQVNGCRGETRTTEQMADRVSYDIWYIEHWSVLLDIRIFFMTLFQIIKGDGQAY